MQRIIVSLLAGLAVLGTHAQLENGGFEDANGFSSAGWEPSFCAQGSGYWNPPPDGGDWCLRLRAASPSVCGSWQVNNYILQKLPWITSGMPIRVNWAWSRDMSTEGMTVCMGIVRNGWLGCSQSWGGGSIYWYDRTEDVSMNLQPDDTAAIALFGGSYSGGVAYSYFDKVEVFSTVGISEITGRSIKVWPNPAGDVVHMDIAEPVIGIDIVDALGQMLAQPVWTVQEGRITLRLEGLPEGPLALRIRTRSATSTVRLLRTT